LGLFLERGHINDKDIKIFKTLSSPERDFEATSNDISH